MYYGLSSAHSAVTLALAVCDVLGHGKNHAGSLLLVETAAAETLLGELKDPTERYAGAGLTQVDEGTFKWLREKFTNSKEERALSKAFGFTLSKVNYSELELSPLLAFVFARLRYKVVVPDIPSSLEGRAKYWKDYYNTDAGKGNEDDYILKAINYVPINVFPDTFQQDYKA
jgi:hypothetical protein